MPAPTNPKKRSLMASTKLRKALRAAGHHLSPVVQVGKEGVTEPVLRQLDEALDAHELVKVKVGTEAPEDRFEVADRMGESAGAQVAQILGRTLLVYRRHPKHPRFEPLAPSEVEAAREARAAERPRRGGRAGRSGRGGAGRAGAKTARPSARGGGSGRRPRS